MYVIDGRGWNAGDAGFGAMLVDAYQRRVRPICACRSVPMCIARLPKAYIVRRLPYAGELHAPDCKHHRSYRETPTSRVEPEQAIHQDPDTGLVHLRLAIGLSLPSAVPHTSTRPERHGVTGAGISLTLEELLRYLWHEADLDRWHPGFAGKRVWAVVRDHLLKAMRGKLVGDFPLSTLAYVPAVFNSSRRAEIYEGYLGHVRAQPPRVALLIGEAKRIVPEGRWHALYIRHLPDHPLLLDDVAFECLVNEHLQALRRWDAGDGIQMMAISTVVEGPGGRHHSRALGLMPVDAQWLPIERFANDRSVPGVIGSGDR